MDNSFLIEIKANLLKGFKRRATISSKQKIEIESLIEFKSGNNHLYPLLITQPIDTANGENKAKQPNSRK